MEMFKTIHQAWRLPEMRSKIIFTFCMLVVYRIGSHIPVPGINQAQLASVFSDEMGIFEMFDFFSGGAFSNFTIFALSITPYITSSIIIQLLTMAFPYFQALSKEGNTGRKKIARITRFLTIILGLAQAVMLTLGLFSSAMVDDSVGTLIVIVLVLTAGTAFLMWLGEQINERGVGNGISLIIFSGIVSTLPAGVIELWTGITTEGSGITIVTVLIFAVLAIVVIMGIIMIQQGTRKIPVQYAKRVVGRKMYGGQSTHIPIKVNQAGVIPVIFAMSLLQFPLTITMLFPNDSEFTNFVTTWLSPAGEFGVWIYSALSVVFIIFFTYFYTAMSFNPMEVAANMKANGGFIPGIRPGRATVEYLNKVMTRLCLVGALFLAAVAIMPTIVSTFTPLNIAWGGTSLLIVIGVALDTMRQIENQMLMRNYEGFLK